MFQDGKLCLLHTLLNNVEYFFLIKHMVLKLAEQANSWHCASCQHSKLNLDVEIRHLTHFLILSTVFLFPGVPFQAPEIMTIEMNMGHVLIFMYFYNNM